MKNLAFIILTVLLFLIPAGCGSNEKTSSNSLPEISLYDRADLEKARQIAMEGVDPFSTAVDSLKVAADKAMPGDALYPY